MVAVGIHRGGTRWLVVGGVDGQWCPGMGACGTRMLAAACAVLVRAVPLLCLVDSVGARGGVPCREICRGVVSHGW